MKKNEKETAILIAVCAFISLLILSPFMFFLLSNEHEIINEDSYVFSDNWKLL